MQNVEQTPGPAAKEATRLPVEVTEPSGPEEKLAVMLVEPGGGRSRTVPDLNAEPEQEWTFMDPKVEPIKLTDEYVSGNHSSERGKSIVAPYFWSTELFESVHAATHRIALASLQDDLTDFINYWLSQIGEIENLQDATNRQHVIRHVGLFLTETGKHLKRLLPDAAKVFNNTDFPETVYGVQENMDSLKISATRLKHTCLGFTKEKDPGKSKKMLDQLKKEYLQIKTELESLFKKKLTNLPDDC